MVLSDEQLTEIEQRANAATEKPWANLRDYTPPAIWSRGPTCRFQIPHNNADREFIAHARADIPALCATVKHLREENQRLTKHVADLEHDFSESEKFCQEHHR